MTPCAINGSWNDFKIQQSLLCSGVGQLFGKKHYAGCIIVMYYVSFIMFPASYIMI